MLMRTDPFRELDRLTQQLLAPQGRLAQLAAMPMDAWRDGDSFHVEFDLPGVNRDSIDIDAESNVVTIKAERPTRASDAELHATSARSRRSRDGHGGEDGRAEVRAALDRAAVRQLQAVRNYAAEHGLQVLGMHAAMTFDERPSLGGAQQRDAAARRKARDEFARLARVGEQRLHVIEQRL